MKILTVIPTQVELDLFLQGCHALGYLVEASATGKLTTAYLTALNITAAIGGLGKAQFAVQTQHLIDLAHWDLVVCAGAAGALAEGLSTGDVVIATETVEHDIRNLFGVPHLPRFSGSKEILDRCRQAFQTVPIGRVHFGPIASGDEDIADRKRREAVLHQIQRLMHERVMHAPIFEPATLHGVGPRIEEAAIGLNPLLYFAAPYEDIRLKKP